MGNGVVIQTQNPLGEALDSAGLTAQSQQDNGYRGQMLQLARAKQLLDQQTGLGNLAVNQGQLANQTQAAQDTHALQPDVQAHMQAETGLLGSQTGLTDANAQRIRAMTPQEVANLILSGQLTAAQVASVRTDTAWKGLINKANINLQGAQANSQNADANFRNVTAGPTADQLSASAREAGARAALYGTQNTQLQEMGSGKSLNINQAQTVLQKNPAANAVLQNALTNHLDLGSVMNSPGYMGLNDGGPNGQLAQRAIISMMNSPAFRRDMPTYLSNEANLNKNQNQQFALAVGDPANPMSPAHNLQGLDVAGLKAAFAASGLNNMGQFKSYLLQYAQNPKFTGVYDKSNNLLLSPTQVQNIVSTLQWNK